MESVGKTMSQMNRSQQFNYEELVAQILAEPEIATFIQKEGLSDVEIRRSISKFNQYISERNRFVLGDADYIARGYKPVLVMNEGYADVSYEETPELIEAQKQAAINKRLKSWPILLLPILKLVKEFFYTEISELGKAI